MSRLSSGLSPGRSPALGRPLPLGPDLRVWPPVVLAPMAGVTSYPFRKLCYDAGAGLCVSEMVSCQGLLQENRKTRQLLQFGRDERPRSIQLFGNDPVTMGEAARRLVQESRVDHIDINFGCPVPKLVRKGMGAAVPADPVNCRRVVSAVVEASRPVPVTIKVRLGLDDDRPTYLEAGRIAEETGCAWITLHGRTASQRYRGRARWEPIAELKSALSIPVLGNGDLFAARDVERRVRESGVDGVVIGRGCLGNPWLFRELRALFEGEPIPARPGRDEIVAAVREHFRLLRDHFCFSTQEAILRMRRLGAWYASGFRAATELRRRFQHVATESELELLLEAWESSED